MPKLIYRFFNGFLDQTIDVSDMLASLAFDGEVGDLNHNLCPLIMYNCFLLLLQPTRSACLQFKYTCIGFMTVQFPLKLQQKHLYLDMVDWVFMMDYKLYETYKIATIISYQPKDVTICILLVHFSMETTCWAVLWLAIAQQDLKINLLWSVYCLVKPFTCMRGL